MKRYPCLEALAPLVGNRVVVTNIGPTRSEWEKVRPCDANLYQAQLGTVTAISLGLAIALSKARSDLGVAALDGDGNLLLAPGVLATVAHIAPPGLIIIVFNYGCYESTGGQPTVTARGTDLEKVAKGFGLEAATTVTTPEAFIDAARSALGARGPQLIVARVEPSSGRQEFLASVQPSTVDGIENKYRLACYIEKEAGVRVLSPPEYATGYSPAVGRD